MELTWEELSAKMYVLTDQQAGVAASAAIAEPVSTSANEEQQRGSRFEELKAAQGSSRRRTDKPKRAAFRDVVSTSNVSWWLRKRGKSAACGSLKQFMHGHR
jgi:hypothetical protein